MTFHHDLAFAKQATWECNPQCKTDRAFHKCNYMTLQKRQRVAYLSKSRAGMTFISSSLFLNNRAGKNARLNSKQRTMSECNPRQKVVAVVVVVE